MGRATISPRRRRTAEHLAFIRLENDGDTAGELWIANADGSDAQLLVPVAVSHDPASSEGEPAAAFHPTWSPDSSTIAFMTTIGLDGGDLQLVDPETGTVSAPDPTVWVSSYSWARDSTSIVYVSGSNDVSPLDIGVLDIESLDTSTLVAGTAAYGGVTVSPTGSEVIFVNSDLPLPPEGDGGFTLSKPGLYSVALAGGEPTTVAPDPDPDDYRWGVRDSAKLPLVRAAIRRGHRRCAAPPALHRRSRTGHARHRPRSVPRTAGSVELERDRLPRGGRRPGTVRAHRARRRPDPDRRGRHRVRLG